MEIKENLKIQFEGLVNSYSQIFFSENKFFAFILILISFFDVQAGIAGILSVVTSNLLAWLLSSNTFALRKGTYGFNALLAGLGFGLYFSPSIALYVLLFFTAIFTLFITISAEGFLAKYSLPFLSIPFLLSTWIVTLGTQNFSALHISELGIYRYNEMYATGGTFLVNIYEFGNNIDGFASLKIYFQSLGAIFFQHNYLAGILVSIGLLSYSRISFSLSLIGFYSAYAFYNIAGLNFTELSYTYIGFNYILTSIALGGFFILPSKRSYFLVVALLPVTVILNAGLEQLFKLWDISILSLPFNISVLMFLYIIKIRPSNKLKLVPATAFQATPEKTLYQEKTTAKRLKEKQYFNVSLPFWGVWDIMQGHNGQYTHKGNWQHAWDFVIKNEQNSQFKNNGDFVADYFCYGKMLIAPAAGYVVSITDGIPDNIIGDINTIQNWGNTIVIKHSEYLFSQISHIQAKSFRVKEGDYVKKAQPLALAGNSGHSPYPHVHFQLQAYGFAGAQTLKYPLAGYILKKKQENILFPFGIPTKNQKITPSVPEEILKNALHFIPGQIFEVEYEQKNKKQSFTWRIGKDSYNQTYFYTEKNKNIAYFTETETGLVFTNYLGSNKDALFQFFLALYNVKNVFIQDVNYEDFIRPNYFFRQPILFIQDFFAPFFIFLKTTITTSCAKKDDSLSPDFIVLNAQISGSIFRKKIKDTNFEMFFYKNKFIKIENKETETKILLKIKRR